MKALANLRIPLFQLSNICFMCTVVIVKGTDFVPPHHLLVELTTKLAAIINYNS